MLGNIGLPMVCVTVPTMLIALLPIALVEAWVLRRICGLAFREAWRGALIANLVSTVMGIPVAWIILFVVQLLTGGGMAMGIDTPMERLASVTLQAPWLIPYESQMAWMVPAASLVLLAPFFAASVVTEYTVLRWRWIPVPRRLFAGVFWANVLSYTLFAAYYATQLWIGWHQTAAQFLGTVTIPKEVTLYSLDGREGVDYGMPAAEGSFHGYPVLSQVDVTDRVGRRRAINALKNGYARRPEVPAPCFRPRHGVRLVSDGVIRDFVICFECKQFLEFEDDLLIRKSTINSEAQMEIDELIKAANVPITP